MCVIVFPIQSTVLSMITGRLAKGACGPEIMNRFGKPTTVMPYAVAMFFSSCLERIWSEALRRSICARVPVMASKPIFGMLDAYAWGDGDTHSKDDEVEVVLSTLGSEPSWSNVFDGVSPDVDKLDILPIEGFIVVMSQRRTF